MSVALIEERRGEWCRRLEGFRQESLEFCPEFPEIARRWESWWRFAADRPLVVAELREPGSPPGSKGLSLLDQPEAWLKSRRKQLAATRCFGEALPLIRVDIGPVATAAFLGAPLHLADRQETTWQDPLITEWEAAPALVYDPENPWLVRVMNLMERLAADARGRYLVCLPDLTGSIDALANLRSPEAFCLDLFENRESVVVAAARVVDAWEAVYSRMYDCVTGAGAGILQWVCSWSDSPYTVPTCDFNALIGERDFREVCLPSLEEQARRAGRCVFHLDGPDAVRHSTALAQARHITAVQFTPGAGTPSALAHLDRFRELQAHGKPLFLVCPLAEARELAQQLDPGGLALWIEDPHGGREMDDLLEWRDRNFPKS